MCNLFRNTFLVLLVYLNSASLFGVNMKKVAFSLPIMTMGKEGALRAEANLAMNGSLALEWMEWGQGKERREEFSETYRSENPNHSFRSRGRDLGLMFCRFKNGALMSGAHWGLGLGIRENQAIWSHTKGESESVVKNHLEVKGTTVSGRVGYRYVGSDAGFLIGAYLGIKHFQNRVRDVEDSTETNVSNVDYSDQLALKRRLMTQGRIGIELGWAF